MGMLKMTEHLKNTSCPKCSTTGNGKSLSVYDDGNYCHECGYSTRTGDSKLYFGEIQSIEDRKLTKQALGKYNVQQKKITGHLGRAYCYDEMCVIFPFYKNGKIVKQKIRSLSDKKKCIQVGQTKEHILFGMQSYTPTKKVPVIVMEGEFDAVAVGQAMGYPAVSAGGSNEAPKTISENIEWLSGFAHVVLCFDSDEAGQAAIDNCLGLFEPGTVRVAHLPLKDANDMILAGREEELKRCIWNAEIIRPSTIVTANDIIDRVLKKPDQGVPWPFKTLNEFTYGMCESTMYTLVSAEAVGKTEFVKELIFGMINKKCPVGLFSFEQRAESTYQRLIGSVLNKKLHLPDQQWWNEDVIRKEADKLTDLLYCYDNVGQLSLSSVVNNIRYLVKCCGVKLIIIDNLTALSSSSLKDGKYISELNYIIQCAGQFSSLCNELKICIILVTHVNNDTLSKTMYIGTTKKEDDKPSLSINEMQTAIDKPGTTWESGRVPSMTNIYCGGALRKLSDVVLVLSRNRVAEDDKEKRTTKVKILKNRIDSSKDGKTFDLVYNYSTGRLEEESTYINTSVI